MTLALDASGTQTAVISTEHILDTPTVDAAYVFEVDTTNMALGDVLELRVYDMVDGTNYRQVWKTTCAHVQVNVGKASPPLSTTTQAKMTLKQIAGTGRAFPWRVYRYT